MKIQTWEIKVSQIKLLSLVLLIFVMGCTTNRVETNGMDNFFDGQDMLSTARDNIICSCSKSTSSCTLTWEDTNTKKIVKSATLEVWSGPSLNKNLIFEKTVMGSKGTITYEIKDVTPGNKYTTKCFFETNEWFDNKYS